MTYSITWLSENSNASLNPLTVWLMEVQLYSKPIPTQRLVECVQEKSQFLPNIAKRVSEILSPPRSNSSWDAYTVYTSFEENKVLYIVSYSFLIRSKLQMWRLCQQLSAVASGTREWCNGLVDIYHVIEVQYRPIYNISYYYLLYINLQIFF